MDNDKVLQNEQDNAGVRVPPPLIFLALLLTGLWYDSPWFEGHLSGLGVTVAGGLIAVLGSVLILLGTPRHSKAGSNVEPWKPTTTIITTGVYGFSRNPIYLGMAIVHGGVAICGGSIGALVTLVIAVAVIRIYVIDREERYLEAKFGETYTSYKAMVRRWL